MRVQRIPKKHPRQSRNHRDQRGMVHISPGQVLPAGRVVQFIPKIAVAAVPDKMNEARRDGKTDADGLVGFEPSSAIQADGVAQIPARPLLPERPLPASRIEKNP